jgi:hypothetical protein
LRLCQKSMASFLRDLCTSARACLSFFLTLP